MFQVLFPRKKTLRLNFLTGSLLQWGGGWWAVFLGPMRKWRRSDWAEGKAGMWYCHIRLRLSHGAIKCWNVFAGSYQTGEWRRHLYTRTLIIWCKSCFPGGSVVKNLPAKAGAPGDKSEIPGSGRSPGGENGNPLQYSCLENPMNIGAWWAIIHGVSKSWTWLSMHACTLLVKYLFPLCEKRYLTISTVPYLPVSTSCSSFLLVCSLSC